MTEPTTPMTAQEKLLRRLAWLLSFTAVVVVFLAVVVVGLEIQVQSRNARLARLDTAVQQTKVAADKATSAANGGKKVIDNALAEAKTAGGDGPSGKDIKAALVKIDVIERQIQEILDRR